MKLSRAALSFFFAFSFLLSSGPVRAEDVPHVRDYAKRVVKRMASRDFWGRGYTKHGMEKAQHFLEREIKSIGLAPLAGKSFLQPFSYPVQTFPGKMDVQLNGHALTPGVDFIVSPGAAGGVRGGDLVAKSGSSTDFTDPTGKVTVSLMDKLTWSVSQTVDSTTRISVDRAKFKEIPKSFAFDIDTKFVPVFHANNLTAVVRGTAKPDRYFIFTAHYDHLGGMGTQAYFPGANDNASGVSLLLSLAKYYVAHPQPYSIGFIFFAGEEAGLVGSKYFVEHPTIDLKKIRLVMNFDLEGTGEEGATVVNATEFPADFSVLRKINDEGHYLVQIGSRGKAANSDHYWFTEHGVPAFFMYTMGGIKAYHDVFDRWQTLPLNKIDDVFALTLKFGQAIATETSGER
jgi:hypothetical protein